MTDQTTSLIEKLLLLMLAGAIATAAFEIYGKVISPLLGSSNIAPVPLAASVFKAIAGFSSRPAANFLHYFAGVVAYPFAFAFIARPLWQKIAPDLPWYLVAIAFGCLQWVFAVYVMAHLIAGQAAFLGFTGITWAALYAHIVYALVAIGITQHFTLSRARLSGSP